MDDAALIRRMHMLIKLNEPEHGGPFGGSAATTVVETMAVAVKRLEELTGLNEYGLAHG